LKIYIEHNNFYSNYLRCWRLGKHLPFEVTFFETYDSGVAEKYDLCLFQSYYLHKYFSPKIKYIWDLNDVLENKEKNTPEKREEVIIEMKRCFEKCSAVIFGSQGLYDHYKDWYSGKYMIQGDYIDPCDHTAKNQQISDGKIRIGFMGSDMYKQEVEELLPIMKKLKKEYNIEFVVLGVNGADTGEFKHIPYDTRYDEFQYLFASQGLDIGVIYQKNREVMLAKNYLKWAEFAWLGIPVVASEWITGKYIPQRYYLPFNTLKECYRALKRLITNKELRQQISKESERYVQRFSLHNFVDRYIKFFKEDL